MQCRALFDCVNGLLVWSPILTISVPNLISPIFNCGVTHCTYSPYPQTLQSTAQKTLVRGAIVLRVGDMGVMLSSLGGRHVCTLLGLIGNHRLLYMAVSSQQMQCPLSAIDSPLLQLMDRLPLHKLHHRTTMQQLAV